MDFDFRADTDRHSKFPIYAEKKRTYADKTLYA